MHQSMPLFTVKGHVPMNVYHPESLAEAEDILRTVDRAIRVGGCTSVRLLWRHGGPVPAALVSLARVDALKVCVRDHKNAIRLGTALPLSDIEHPADVRRECPALAGTIRRIATPTVRRLGTLGGNIGSLSGLKAPCKTSAMHLLSVRRRLEWQSMS
jgi:CO/xanthine dehydrogenase FAD-binding subunit